jgi:PKD repeat protein
MQYLDGGDEQGSGSTTGVEGADPGADFGLTYACDSAGSITDELAMCFAYPGSSGCIAGEVPWFGQNPEIGTVPAEGSSEVTLIFSATEEAGAGWLGDYFATLLVSGDPSIRVPVTLTVIVPAPQAAFLTNSPVYLGEAVIFTNTTIPGDPPTSTFTWDFGDGVTSSLETPAPYVYEAVDTYTVTLEACNEVGCTTDTQQVEVLPLTLPEAAFTASTPVCFGEEVVFTNTTTPGSPPETWYLWEFGDGITSTEATPAGYVYAAAGAYTVTLTASNMVGDSQAAQAVEVNALTEASFTYDVAGLLVEFSNSSTAATSYLWDFGDAVTSTETSPSYEYAAEGEYVVTLTAYGACNMDVVTMTVSVEAPFLWFPLVQKDASTGDR